MKPPNATTARRRRIARNVRAVVEDEKLWEGARQEGHKLIEASAEDPRAKMKRKAVLDRKLLEEREREDA